MTMRIGRRHFFIRVIGGDTVDEFALGEFTRHDGAYAAFEFLARIRLAIQPKFGLARRAVWPVALVAVIGKNGSDVAIE